MKEQDVDRQHPRPSEQGVEEDLRRQRHLFMRLAENALFVAESLRGNYFDNTAKFVSHLRKTMKQSDRTERILGVRQVDALGWPDVRDEVVTFIDGGVGQVKISSQV